VENEVAQLVSRIETAALTALGGAQEDEGARMPEQ
jgi:hypothetical protein